MTAMLSLLLYTVVTVQLAMSEFTVAEGSSSVAVQVAKSGQTVASYSVLLLTVDGSATGRVEDDWT